MAQLLFNHSLALLFFGKRILAQELLVKMLVNLTPGLHLSGLDLVVEPVHRLLHDGHHSQRVNLQLLAVPETKKVRPFWHKVALAVPKYS